MDEFVFRDGVLHGESVDLRTVAQDFGTPLYVYSRKTLIDHFDRTRRAFAPLGATICFSIKSCQNLSILRLLRERGSSFDVVSGGELARAIEAGADPSQIVFAGVGKRDPEIQAALDAGIGWFNVESEAELANIQRLAVASGKKATLALRINPDVDPDTHEYISTGKRETKFGLDVERARRVAESTSERSGVHLTGLHIHIGSQITQVAPYVEMVTRLVALAQDLRGFHSGLESINIGGGFGIHYRENEAPAMTEFADALLPLLKDCGFSVHMEPGRLLVGNAGILVTRVLYEKRGGDKRFIICDAAMNDLIRPSLYGAFHRIEPVEVREGKVTPADVVGPVCESGDFLAQDRDLPPLKRGDLLAVRSAGAYGFVMASNYNARPRAVEVMVDGDRYGVVRARETEEELIRGETAEPDWKSA